MGQEWRVSLDAVKDEIETAMEYEDVLDDPSEAVGHAMKARELLELWIELMVKVGY